MSEELYETYNGELYFIRQLAQDFAKRYPAAAGRLRLEENRSADPHVERLVESFAPLTARVRTKIDDEFPELTDALLQVLYPHYLAPVPSLALLQFQVDPKRAENPNGFALPRHSHLHTQAVGEVPCRYRTCYPLTLWPVTVTEAKLSPPPFPSGLSAPARAVAALRLKVETPPEADFGKLNLSRLRLYLHGDAAYVSTLYELMLNHTLQVVARPADRKGGDAVVLRPEECVAPVGFAPEEGLLPYPRQAFPGYRLLTEFFAFPQKFYFVDLLGWEKIRVLKPGRAVELVFFVNRTWNRLEQSLEPSMFRPNCTPAVNLFEHTCEPIALTQTRHSYHVVPDVTTRGCYEIYSIDRVTAADPGGGDRDYLPFYSFRHSPDGREQRAFYYASRRASLVENDRGTEIDLHLVDLDFDPFHPADSALVVRATCTNRDLPLRLPRVGTEVRFEPEFAAPLAGIQCLVTPTSPLRPPLRRGLYWRLLAHLNLNHLSLTDADEGRDALREILRLYDFSDPEVEPQLAAVARQTVDGIEGVECRRVVGRVGGPVSGGFCRGLEVTLTFDEQKYTGTSVYMFASVLERFLGLYVSVNSFSQLVARTRQGEGVLKRWPPRAGEQPLL